MYGREDTGSTDSCVGDSVDKADLLAATGVVSMNSGAPGLRPL